MVPCPTRPKASWALAAILSCPPSFSVEAAAQLPDAAIDSASPPASVSDATVGEPAPLPRRLVEDLKDLVRAPGRTKPRGWAKTALGAGLVLGLHAFDEEARSELDPTSDSRLAHDIRPIGHRGAVAFLATSWLAGRATDRPKWVAIGRDGTETAVLAAGIVTPLLKQVVGRERPREDLGDEAFGSSGRSFPSGEVTMAFSVASVVARHSERRWVDAVAWTLASATAWQRMELDAHWLSDVGAAALIGASIGSWVTKRNDVWSIRVAVGPAGGSLTLRRGFDAVRAAE